MINARGDAPRQSIAAMPLDDLQSLADSYSAATAESMTGLALRTSAST
jgi:hypothetical protein